MIPPALRITSMDSGWRAARKAAKSGASRSWVSERCAFTENVKSLGVRAAQLATVRTETMR